jgi:hypothetical protein
MSDSDTAVPVENPLLEKWRTHAKRAKRMHGAAATLFKARADMALYSTLFLSLGVGCLNLTFGIGRAEAATGVPAIVSGCLSLLSGSVTALNSGLQLPIKAERHDHSNSRFGEVVRDINTECSLRHLHDAEYASEGDFLRHISSEMSRLEESAPNIPRAIENSHSPPKA